MRPVLTIKQKQFILLMSKGKSAKEIAVELKISINTVKTRKRSLFKKFSVNRVTDLVNCFTKRELKDFQIEVGGKKVADAGPSVFLTEREIEVIEALSNGLTAAKIAKSLKIAANTVKGHIRNVQQKLDANNSTEAVVKYLKIKAATPKIVRTIEFRQDHLQAGISILSYFGEILREKCPAANAIVRIEQDGFIVRMIIEFPDSGDREIIEKTLREYGEVATGRRAAENWLANEEQIRHLRHKLEIAIIEIEFYKRERLNREKNINLILNEKNREIDRIYENQAEKLDINAGFQNAEGLGLMVDLLREAMNSTHSLLNNSIEIIQMVIVQRQDLDVSTVNTALENIKQKRPNLFQAIGEFAEKIAGTAGGGILKEILMNFPG